MRLKKRVGIQYKLFCLLDGIDVGDRTEKLKRKLKHGLGTPADIRLAVGIINTHYDNIMYWEPRWGLLEFKDEEELRQYLIATGRLEN